MTPKAQKIITRTLIGGLLAIIFLYGLAFTIFYFSSTPTFFDRPSNLNNKAEMVEVMYVNWACDCPNFIDTKFYKNNPDYEPKEEDCIFIEPDKSDLKIPESFYLKDHFKKKLRLTGKFYQNKGVPETYEQKTPEKPEKAKVFRYEKIEIINKD